jgi:hypothetical protein
LPERTAIRWNMDTWRNRTRNRQVIAGIICVLTAAVYACTESPTALPNVNPAFLDVVSGSEQAGRVGEELQQPLVARVRNSDNQPVDGQIVNFRVIKGGGSVFAGTAITNADGLAQERWTLGTSIADSQIVEARAVDPSSGAPLIFARFVATAVAGPAATIEKTSGDAQTGAAGGPLPDSLLVQVKDSYGNVVSGATVLWSVASGIGTVSRSSDVTTATGFASTKWTLGPEVGEQSVQAAAGTAPSATFTASALSPSTLVLTKSAGDNQTAAPGEAVPVPPRVQVKDASGSPRPGITVTFAVTQGDGSVTGASALADASGMATVGSWVLGQRVGTNALSASVSGGATVTFTAAAVQASPDISMSIASPPSGLVGDAVDVRVNVTSRLQIATVTAALAGRNANLNSSSPGVWTGTLSLTGAPRDTMTLVATATDVNGSIAQAVVALTHDLPPNITLTSPANNSGVSGSVTIDASCTDDDPNGCTISAEVSNGSQVRYVGPTPSPMHTSVSLAGFEGQQVTVVVYARDSKSQTSGYARNTVWAESSHFQFIGAAEGTLLDASDSRLLWRSESRTTIGIRNLTTGSSEPIISTLRESDYIMRAFLTPTGAAFAVDGGASLYIWRSGSLTTKTLNSASSLAASGNFIIYNTPSLYRTDVTTGADVLVASDAGNWANDVSDNGDVAYWNSSYKIVRDRNGVKTPVTSGDPQIRDTYPLTDGINIVYRREPPTGDTRHELWIYAGSSLTMLAPASQRLLTPHRDYEVNSGWTAFTKDDASGHGQIWTRSPTGVLRAVSPTGSSSVIQGLGSDGTIIYDNGADRYLAGPTGTPTRISVATHSNLVSHGPVLWRNGRFVVLVNNGAFAITP